MSNVDLGRKKKFVRLLRDNGYFLHRSGKGSHMIYMNAEGDKVLVPYRLNKMIEKRLIKELGLK